MSNENLIWFACGVRQENLLGQILFSIATYHIASSRKFMFNAWYLDSATTTEDQYLCVMA